MKLLNIAQVFICFVVAEAALSHFAFAWESFAEFESLSEQEQSAFDQPSLFGAEYQSDVLAYAKPAEWEYKWLTHEIAFDASFGSIDSVRFMTDTRAKLRGKLSDAMQFRFTYFDERNLDRQSNHTVFEFVFRPAIDALRPFGVSVYGEPSFYKRQNDVGVALLWWPSDNHEVRFFHTRVDVTRQKRNDLNDKFDENKLPYVFGLVGRRTGGKASFIEYAIRHETSVVWHYPDQLYDYRYWREFASIYASHRWGDFWGLTARVQADRKFEARDLVSAASDFSALASTTDRLMTNVEGKVYGLGVLTRADLTLGLEWAHRKWSQQLDTLIYNDWLPHIQLGLPGFGGGRAEGRWELGYQFVWHRKTGGGIIDHPTDKDNALNHRLDIKYCFNFAASAELRLLASFDLDAFATSDTWEGGSAQFRWNL